MRREAIYHRSAYADCYAVNDTQVRITIHTGKEVDQVTILYEDPFVTGISGGIPWEGVPMAMEEGVELANHKTWTCLITPRYQRIQYYFEVISGEETCYVLEDGCYKKEQMGQGGHWYPYFKFAWLNSSDVITVPSWVEDTIWYQIFPERFCRGKGVENRHSLRDWDDVDNRTYFDFYGGNIRGIIQKLDYIKELGVTGIYLTPIFLSESNHKYDTTDYMVVDPDFGSEEELVTLIDEAHKRGIRVMLDAVFNHCGSNFKPWLDVKEKGRKSPYYEWFFVYQEDFVKEDAKTKDGRYASFAFEANMPKLNTNNKEVQDYFISLCTHWVEDYKIDGIRFDVGDEVSHSFLKRLRGSLKEKKEDLYLLGEVWQDSMPWLMGDEYDSVMNYPFLVAVSNFFGDKTENVEQLMFAINRILTMYPEQIVTVLFQFLDTHDTIRAASRSKTIEEFFAQLALLLTMPGTPCLYYGTEIAMEGPKNPYNRSCMPWLQIEQGEYEEISSKVRKLISLRKENPLAKSNKIQWHINPKEQRLIHYEKQGEDEVLEVYSNQGEQTVEVDREGNVLFALKAESTCIYPGGTLIKRRGVKNEEMQCKRYGI